MKAAANQCGLNRRKLQTIERASSDRGTTNTFDRAGARSPVCQVALKWIAARCCDNIMTCALVVLDDQHGICT